MEDSIVQRTPPRTTVYCPLHIFSFFPVLLSINMYFLLSFLIKVLFEEGRQDMVSHTHTFNIKF